MKTIPRFLILSIIVSLMVVNFVVACPSQNNTNNDIAITNTSNVPSADFSGNISPVTTGQFSYHKSDILDQYRLKYSKLTQFKSNYVKYRESFFKIRMAPTQSNCEPTTCTPVPTPVITPVPTQTPTYRNTDEFNQELMIHKRTYEVMILDGIDPNYVKDALGYIPDFFIFNIIPEDKSRYIVVDNGVHKGHIETVPGVNPIPTHIIFIYDTAKRNLTTTGSTCTGKITYWGGIVPLCGFMQGDGVCSVGVDPSQTSAESLARVITHECCHNIEYGMNIDTGDLSWEFFNSVIAHYLSEISNQTTTITHMKGNEITTTVIS